MRNLSKEQQSNYYKFQTSPRNKTTEKKIQETPKLKDNQIRIGIYKYSTDDQLGKGYSSKVYRGFEIDKLHKRYAIKVVDLKKFRGSSLEMLQAQIDIHKNLVHENILRLYEIIKTPTVYYLILQYCPHGSLQEYIRQKTKLSQSNAIQIMDQILTGYRYLMENDIVHRDLKPSNILRVGNKWKLSDFGFAVKTRCGFKDRTNVGTPLYMPPQSLKSSYYSTKTDIFALGVILYQMIVGETPWQSSNQAELLQKMMKELQLPESFKNQKVIKFTEKCCQLNENKRMSKEQLAQFQFYSQIQLSARSSMMASSSSSNLKKGKFSLMSQSTNPTTLFLKSALDEQQNKQNFQILSNQFHFAKLIYSCLKNIDCFLIQNQSKQIFILTLFKLLLRLIRFLCDRKMNNYRLKRWDEFVKTRSYQDLQQQFVFYSQMFEKEYLDQIKHNDIKIIRTVNRKFPDLSHTAPISDRFYQTLKNYMGFLIREHNHELMLIHNANQQKLKNAFESTLNVIGDVAKNDEHQLKYANILEIKDKIQALQSLHTIYCVADLKSNSTQNKGISLDKIKVVLKYQESTLTKHDYLDLRRLLKNI